MLLKTARHEMRSLAGLWPAVFYNLFWLRKTNRPLFVRRDSEIVIEGFPRSANTFSVIAFRQAQTHPVKIAHHLHVPAQVIRAVKWSVPTVVLLRNPVDAATSLLVRYPYDSPRRVLNEYCRFYRRLYPLHRHFVVAEFSGVVNEFGSVIRRVNNRFGTDFGIFEHTSESIAKVFDRVQEVHVKKRETSNQLAKPSAEKERLKKTVKTQIEAPALTPLVRDAMYWYERYMMLLSES